MSGARSTLPTQVKFTTYVEGGSLHKYYNFHGGVIYDSKVIKVKYRFAVKMTAVAVLVLTKTGRTFIELL